MDESKLTPPCQDAAFIQFIDLSLNAFFKKVFCLSNRFHRLLDMIAMVTKQALAVFDNKTPLGHNRVQNLTESIPLIEIL